MRELVLLCIHYHTMGFTLFIFSCKDVYILTIIHTYLSFSLQYLLVALGSIMLTWKILNVIFFIKYIKMWNVCVRAVWFVMVRMSCIQVYILIYSLCIWFKLIMAKFNQINLMKEILMSIKENYV